MTPGPRIRACGIVVDAAAERHLARAAEAGARGSGVLARLLHGEAVPESARDGDDPFSPEVPVSLEVLPDGVADGFRLLRVGDLAVYVQPLDAAALRRLTAAGHDVADGRPVTFDDLVTDRAGVALVWLRNVYVAARTRRDDDAPPTP